MSKKFYFKQYNLAQAHSFVLFDRLLGAYQVLPIQGQSGSESDRNKGVTPQAPALLKPHHPIFSVISRTLVEVGEVLPL